MTKLLFLFLLSFFTLLSIMRLEALNGQSRFYGPPDQTHYSTFVSIYDSAILLHNIGMSSDIVFVGDFNADHFACSANGYYDATNHVYVQGSGSTSDVWLIRGQCHILNQLCGNRLPNDLKVDVRTETDPLQTLGDGSSPLLLGGTGLVMFKNDSIVGGIVKEYPIKSYFLTDSFIKELNQSSYTKIRLSKLIDKKLLLSTLLTISPINGKINIDSLIKERNTVDSATILMYLLQDNRDRVQEQADQWIASKISDGKSNSDSLIQLIYVVSICLRKGIDNLKMRDHEAAILDIIKGDSTSVSYQEYLKSGLVTDLTPAINPFLNGH